MNRCLTLLFLLLLASKAGSQTPDTIPPYLTCKQPGEVTVKYCTEVLNVAAIIDSLYDDSNLISLGIHRKCLGYSFPNFIEAYFSESDLGSQLVSAWAKDSAGNISSCTTSVKVIHPTNGFCDPTLYLSFKTPLGKGIDSVLFKVRGHNCESDTFRGEIFLGTLGCCQTLSGVYNQLGTITPAPGYEIVAEMIKNDAPLNGVTSYDLTLISKHILGLELLDSPYKIIAADINQDGKVTTFDIIVLRKLILGIIDELPNGKSWRFIPAGYAFPNPMNPFDPPFPDHYFIPSTEPDPPSDFPFFGLKIGDVNNSAFPGG